MFYDHVQLIQKEIDPKRLYNGVKEISSYHRIQASTGFRKAAHHALDMLQKRGIEARILEFEAKKDVWYLEQKMFQEWDCREAYLDLVSPEKRRLVDFSREACSIIQKSYPCDYRQQPLDVVMLESLDEDIMKRLDLKGKMIFIHEMPAPYVYTAVKKYGAIGIITDFMREVEGIRHRYEAFDTFNYTSFWWNHRDDEPHTFGFVLSPRLGDQLRKLCLEMEQAYQKDPSKPRYPQVAPYIDASLYDGHMEVVEAWLKGESDEEVMMSAHLCHPHTSANDNASGVSATIEVLTTLKTLLDEGKLPPLKRTIRLILIPEFTGTHCYLSTLKDYHHIKAAINMDMVGGKQDGTYGPITMTRTPFANHSLVNPLTDLVLEEVKKQVAGLDDGDYASLVNSRIGPFTGGSDHEVFNDPTIGAPCIMVGQWPDKYYHTSSDTLECINPRVLAFSASFAASYVYTLANLSLEDISLIYPRLEVMMMDDLAHILNRRDLSANDTFKMLKGIVDSYEQTAMDITRFGLDETIAKQEKAYVHQLGTQVIERFVTMHEHQLVETLEVHPERERRFKRLFVGPIRDLDDYIAKDPKNEVILEKFNQDHPNLGFAIHSLQSLVPHFLDGQHTLQEVADAMFIETEKHQEELIVDFVELLAQLDLVKEV